MTNSLEHQELLALLPFFANGTLSSSQRAEFEAALANSPDLRAQLETARNQMEFVKTGAAQLFENITTSANHEGRLAKLRNKIDNFEKVAKVAPKFKIKLGALISEFFAQHYKPALVMAGALFGILCFNLGSRIFEIIAPQPAAKYETMAGVIALPKTGRTRFLIRLRPQANWQQIEELLLSEDAQIIAGPNDGLIQIEMKNELGERAIKAINARLSASPLVEFAGVMP